MPTLGNIPSDPNDAAALFEQLYRAPSAQPSPTLDQAALNNTLDAATPGFIGTPGGTLIPNTDGNASASNPTPGQPFSENPDSAAVDPNFAEPYQAPALPPNAYKIPNTGGGATPGGNATPGSGGGGGATPGGNATPGSGGGGGATPGGNATPGSSGGGSSGGGLGGNGGSTTTIEAPPSLIPLAEAGGGAIGLGSLGAIALATLGLLGLDLLFPQSTANDSPPPQPQKPTAQPAANPQTVGADCVVYTVNTSTNYNPAFSADSAPISNTSDVTVYGPVGGFRWRPSGSSRLDLEIYCRGPYYSIPRCDELKWWPLGNVFADISKPYTATINKITGPNAVDIPPIPPGFNQLVSDNIAPGIQPGDPAIPPYNPITQPPPSQPNEQNKKAPVNIPIPANTPISISQPGSPEIYIPGGQLGWGLDIPPDDTPYPNGQGLQIGQPGQDPTAINFPGANPTGGPITIKIPGYEPVSIDPTGQTAPQGLGAPDPLNGNKQGLVPAPLTATPPTTDPGKQTTPAPFLYDPTLQSIATGLTGLGIVVKGILDQTSAANQQKNAAAGVCQTTAPGGCTSNLVNNAGNNTANAINTTLNGADLSLLKIIDNKLGAQIPTGIGPVLQGLNNAFNAFKSFDILGKAMQIITMMTALHNAFFLSAAIKQTLLQMISDWIKVFAPDFSFKDEKGNDVGLNTYVNKFIEHIFEDALGKDRVKEYETLFKVVNRIYQSAANVINSVQMIIFSVTGALNIIGSNVASIGEALKKYGVVGHHAFPGQNVNPNFFTKAVEVVQGYTQQVTGYLAGIAAIDCVAQSIIGGRQAIDQIQQQKNETYKEMQEAYKAGTAIVSGTANDAANKNTAKAISVSPGAKPTSEQYGEIKSGAPTGVGQ